jgi:Ca2+-transporting ATPase
MIHIPLVATAALIPLGGYPLLYLPVHVVWLELIIHPTALLVFQELPAGSRLTPIGKRERSGRFFTTWEWVVVGVVGAVITIVIVGGYARSLGDGGNVEHARAMALVVLVLASATLTAGLSGLRTWIAWLTCVASIASAVLLVQIPKLAQMLNLEALHIDDWIVATAAGVVPGLFASLLRWRAAGVPRV